MKNNMLEKLPAPVRTVAEQAVPALKGAALVVNGAVNAEIGGRLLRKVSAVEAFASRGAWADGVIDLSGGVALDAVELAAVAAWKGPALAKSFAAPLLTGTVLKAGFSTVKPYVDRGVDWVLGMLGVGDDVPAPTPGGLLQNINIPALPAPGGYGPNPSAVNLFVPGGLNMFGAVEAPSASASSGW